MTRNNQCSETNEAVTEAVHISASDMQLFKPQYRLLFSLTRHNLFFIYVQTKTSVLQICNQEF